MKIKSYKDILFIIIIVFLVLSFFYCLPILRINNVIRKIKKIDTINSTNITANQTLNYKDYDTNKIIYNILTFNVSNNVTTIDPFFSYGFIPGSIYTYKLNDIDITVLIQKIEDFSFIESKLTNFNIGNREFFIGKSGSEHISICTNIYNNLYYIVELNFRKNVLITKNELSNLKPFLEISLR